MFYSVATKGKRGNRLSAGLRLGAQGAEISKRSQPEHQDYRPGRRPHNFKREPPWGQTGSGFFGKCKGRDRQAAGGPSAAPSSPQRGSAASNNLRWRRRGFPLWGYLKWRGRPEGGFQRGKPRRGRGGTPFAKKAPGRAGELERKAGALRFLFSARAMTESGSIGLRDEGTEATKGPQSSARRPSLFLFLVIQFVLQTKIRKDAELGRNRRGLFYIL